MLVFGPFGLSPPQLQVIMTAVLVSEFQVIEYSELPEEWKRAPPQETVQHVAAQYGVTHVEPVVVVEMPECLEALAYQAFVRDRGGPDSVKVMVSNRNDFEQAHGSGATQRTLQHLHRHGKPHMYLAMLYLPDMSRQR